MKILIFSDFVFYIIFTSVLKSRLRLCSILGSVTNVNNVSEAKRNGDGKKEWS